MFGNDFENLFEEAYTDIRKSRVAHIYVLGEDVTNETVCVRRPDDRLYDVGGNLLPQLIESKYEYMIRSDILVKNGTLTEGSFNSDDVLGLELFVITDGKEMFDTDSGKVDEYDLGEVWNKSQNYMNFYFASEKDAKKAIRESSWTGAIKATPVKVQPHLVKKVKGMNPEIKKLLKYHADDIRAGIDKY